MKNYKCSICNNDYFSYEFIGDINQWYGLRELRLLCKFCSSEFNNWTNQRKLKFLRQKVENYFGENQFIYALCEPQTSEIRYIGRTNKPQQRLSRHLAGLKELSKEICNTTKQIKLECSCETHQSRNSNNSSRYWIAELQLKNLKPSLEILEKVIPSFRVVERESRWIAYHIKKGTNLLNAENQSSNLKKLIQSYDVCYLTVPLEKLSKNDFIIRFNGLMGEVDKNSGWRQAEFFDRVYKNLKVKPVKT